MKVLIFLFTALLLVSCNNDGNKSTATVTDTLPHTVGISKPDRGVLISEIKRVIAVLASNDKQQLKTFFTFPIPDSILNYYVDDPVFETRKKESPDYLTEDLYDSFFPKISGSMSLKEFRSIADHINPDSLNFKNTLQVDLSNDTLPCSKYYSIDIKDNSVTIVWGTNTNIDYEGKRTDEEKDGACEYAVIWQFEFDGRHLKFVRQAAAG